jgi:hypothetical protein
MRRQSLKCTQPGCERLLNEPKFKSEEALFLPISGWVRKPTVVDRNFLGMCPDHGEIWVAVSGHHISSCDTVGYELNAESGNQIAFAVRNVNRMADLAATFKYLTWDETCWIAHLENIKAQFSSRVSDPYWIHEPAAAGHALNKVDRINYLTKDGSQWHSKVHAHRDLLNARVTYDFEHFPGNSNNSTSNSKNLIFLDWNRVAWEITIPDVTGPTGNGDVLVLFDLHKAP